MVCKKCSREINDASVFCIHCGSAVGDTPGDSGNLLWGLLGFVLAPVGFILYIMWKDTKPRKSKIVGTGALIAVLFSLAMNIILDITGFYDSVDSMFILKSLFDTII